MPNNRAIFSRRSSFERKKEAAGRSETRVAASRSEINNASVFRAKHSLMRRKKQSRVFTLADFKGTDC